MIPRIAKVVESILQAVVIGPLGGASEDHPYQSNGVPEQLTTPGLSLSLDRASERLSSGTTKASRTRSTTTSRKA